MVRSGTASVRSDQRGVQTRRELSDLRPYTLAAVDRALLRALELRLDLLAVLRIHRLGAAQRRVGRNAVALHRLVEERILAGQVVRHAARLDALVADDARR